MKKSWWAAMGLMAMIGQASAHYGMLIPNHPMVVDKKDSHLTLDVAFAHPMDGGGLEMTKPKNVSVHVDGKVENLTDKLQPAKLFGHQSWKVNYDVKRPGVYQFVVSPQGYYDKNEGMVLYSYSKVVVPAFGADSGWAEPLGLKAEIVPYLRPFANFAGQTFVGQALLDGKPQAKTRISVTYYNQDNVKVPNDTFHWFSVYTDENGMFNFSVPFAGWWGFAAINELDSKHNEVAEGKPRPVEADGVMWLYFDKSPK